MRDTFGWLLFRVIGNSLKFPMTQKRSDECIQPTKMWKNKILILGGERSMKGYKKLMDIVAMVEKTVLVVTMILILVLTVGNVFSRKVIHQSWSFTEELVVAIFVLITLLGAALSAREGGLVGLNLVTERLPKSAKKPVMILITIFSVLFMGILFYYGMDKVLAQLANQKRTFVLNWPEWIFWSFVPIGSVCMTLHFIEFCLDVCTKKEDK